MGWGQSKLRGAWVRARGVGVWGVWLVALLGVTTPVRAEQPLWAMGRPTAQAGDEATAQTFHDLVRDKLRARLEVRIVELPDACTEIECVRRAAAPQGAEVAAQVSLRRLGAKVIAGLTAVEVKSGATRFSDSMSTEAVEELDVVAERLVGGLSSGDVEAEGAELGTVTDTEEKAPRRRNGRVAFMFGMQGVFPVQGYSTELAGGGVELGVWFEGDHFAIAPTLGLRTDLARDDDWYFHMPFEVQGLYILTRGDVSPVIGGGAGVHYLHEEVHVSSRTGDVIVSQTWDVIEDSTAGFSVFARAGLMFLRTYDVSMLLSVDYALTAADFQERSTEQAIRVTLDVILGGS